MVNVTSLYIPDKKVVHWRKCGTPQRLTWKNTISRGSRRGAKGLEKVHSAVRNPADPRWLADKCDATGPSWTDFMRKRDLRIQNKGEREKKRERDAAFPVCWKHTRRTKRSHRSSPKEESIVYDDSCNYKEGGKKRKVKISLVTYVSFSKALCALGELSPESAFSFPPPF